MQQISFFFDLPDTTVNEIPYLFEIEHYILNKIQVIVNKYDFYKNKFLRGFNDFINYNISSRLDLSDDQAERLLEDLLQSFLSDINDDKSHVVLKLKQAIYYLKFPKLHKLIYSSIRTGEPIELDTYKLEAEKIINDSDATISLSELLPPAIFKLDFNLDDDEKSSFAKASSGEYQIVSVISSILYHLRNIDSIDNEYRYRHVTILLDEIELYFHPNMQRIFVQKLLSAISKLDSGIWGIHILFATHSPFILSDVVQENTLKLQSGRPCMRDNGYDTFAANIHDLLADEFFLDNGYMGAFAKHKIEIAINLLNYLEEEKKLAALPNSRRYSELLNEYREILIKLKFWKIDGERNTASEKSFLEALISIVGEPIIRQKLEQMYKSIFPQSDKINAVNDILDLAKTYKIDLKSL